MEQIRTYQTESLNLIRSEFQKGNKKVLLFLATGAGKTFIFCKMVKSAVEKNMSCLILVRGRKLVDQASRRLFRESTNHGTLMANHYNYRPSLPVQVASIDTLISRDLTPKADLIIVDEAHLSTSKGYKEVIAKYPNSFIVAVTATPWVDGGLEHVAKSVVHPITMTDLITQGYLCPFRFFAPSSPDLTDVKVSSSTKDYVNDQLEEAMNKGTLTGKIIDHWLKIAGERPTILFAVNIHHSKLLTQRFLDAGIKAEHCDADCSDREREEIIARLESGETKVVCNVGIFCTGVDIPKLGAIVMARPTKSRNLYIQQAGRGTRVFAGKQDCILLDHAGNIHRHGFPTEEPPVDLTGRQRVIHKKEAKICKNCFAVYVVGVCPECGVKPEVEASAHPEESEGRLTEIHFDPVRSMLIQLETQRKKEGKKNGWQYYKIINFYGYDRVRSYLPQWFQKRYEEKFVNSPFKSTRVL